MVQSKPLALTTRSISAESFATFRKRVRRRIALKIPSSSNRTATPTTKRRRKPAACMAVTVLRAASIALKHRHTFTWAAELLGRAYERGHTVASLERLIDQGPARTASRSQDEEPHRGSG